MTADLQQEQNVLSEELPPNPAEAITVESLRENSSAEKSGAEAQSDLVISCAEEISDHLDSILAEEYDTESAVPEEPELISSDVIMTNVPSDDAGIYYAEDSEFYAAAVTDDTGLPDEYEVYSEPVTEADLQGQIAPDSIPTEEIEAAANSMASEAGSKKAKKKHRKQKSGSAKPGTAHIKVDNSRIQVSKAESLHQLRLNLQERQRAFLPKNGASPRSALRHQEKLAGINRALKPFRLIILILMGLCTAGREYDWMTLGIMSGINGTYISIMMTFLAFLVNWQSFYQAIRDIRYVRFSYESFLLIFSVLAMFEGYYYQNAASLLSVLTMAWCVCGMTSLQENQLKAKALRKAALDKNRKSIRLVKKCWDGNDGIGIERATYSGFVRHMEEPDLWHSLFSVFYVIYFLIIFAASVYISMKKSTAFLTVLVQLFILGTPIALIQCNSKPYAMLVNNVRKHGIVSGWYGIRKLHGKKYIMLNNKTLFPDGTIRCYDIRIFAHITESTLISYASSIALEYDIGYQDAFVQLMRDTNGSLMKVESCCPEEGGTRGVIHDDVVLIGSEQYMNLNGITLPKEHRSHSVFLAVNGWLAGEFRMRYSGVKGADKIASAISRDHQLSPLITSANVYVNPKFLSAFFHLTPARTCCPKAASRRTLSQKKTFQNAPVCGYVFQDGLTAYGQIIVGARRLYQVSFIFTVLAMVIQSAVTIRSMSVLLNGGALISGAAIVALNIILAVILELVSRLMFQNS